MVKSVLEAETSETLWIVPDSLEDLEHAVYLIWTYGCIVKVLGVE
jgi:hypothetical protein